MWPIKSKTSTYQAVEASESGSELEYEQLRKFHRRSVPLRTHLLILFFLSSVCLTVGFICGEYIQDNGLIAKFKATSTKSSKCRNPEMRKEWRSLSISEKLEYINAVQCLTSKQSKLSSQPGDTLYNDFPYLHTTIGGYCEYIGWP